LILRVASDEIQWMRPAIADRFPTYLLVNWPNPQNIRLDMYFRLKKMEEISACVFLGDAIIGVGWSGS